MEKKVITEEQFRGVCKQALPHLKELIENLREIGFDGIGQIGQKFQKRKERQSGGHEQIARDGELHIHVVEPFDQDDTEWYILTKEKFLNGLAKYLKEPKYSDCLEFVNHELRIDTCYIDADVADTIIQYALFGEVVYG